MAIGRFCLTFCVFPVNSLALELRPTQRHSGDKPTRVSPGVVALTLQCPEPAQLHCGHSEPLALTHPSVPTRLGQGQHKQRLKLYDVNVNPSFVSQNTL